MRAIVVLFAALLASCGVRLDEPAPAESGKTKAPPLAPACRLFARSDIVSVSGRVSSVPLDDGTSLWIAGSVETSSGSTPNAGFIVGPGDSADGCFADATLLDHSVLDTSVLAPGDSLNALAPVVVDGARYLFYDLYEPAPGQPFGVARAGTGVAKWDASRQVFVPSASLLFTADRPSYGGAAVVDGDFVYVYGCIDVGLNADCSVARAAKDAIDDESQYAFYSGGGHFSPSADEAWPMVDAGDPLAVVEDAGRGRWYLVYAPPLGGTLVARSGLSPWGPWSKPLGAASCELSSKDAFCSAAVAHPELARENGLFVSYAITTFTPGAAEAAPLEYWTRLARVQLPAELP